MTKELVHLPNCLECDTVPDGWGRKEWRAHGEHYLFIHFRYKTVMWRALVKAPRPLSRFLSRMFGQPEHYEMFIRQQPLVDL